MRSPSFWHSLGFAASGILYTLRTQRNARIHVVILALVVLAGLTWRLTPVEWASVFLVSGLVIALEMMNSALEGLIDLVHPDIHPRVKVIKDTAAGAVLIAAMTAVAVGIIVFGPRLWQFLQTAVLTP